MCSKDIEFVSVSDGLPDDHHRLHDLPALFDATLGMGPAFEKLFINLLRESLITCVIRDAIMTVAHERARKLGIPVVGFATPSAIACVYHLSTLVTADSRDSPDPASSTQCSHTIPQRCDTDARAASQ